MEGKKQYVLPALAAVVLILLLVARNNSGMSDGTPAPETPPPTETPAKGTKATIRDAVEAAGSPALGEDARKAIHSALGPVVERCRASHPAAATQALRVSVEVLAAGGVGILVERAEVEGAPPADLVGCLREGMLSAKPGDIGQTGRISATLEYAAS